MENTMKSAEQLASDTLGLDGDFRKVKKEKLVSLFSDLSKMPQETAYRVIDKFPVAIGNATATAKELFEKIPAFLEDESKSREKVMDMLTEDDRRCWERINDPSVDDEEKAKCYQRLESNKGYARAESSDSRKFKLDLYDHSGAILIATVGICLTVLGVNGKFPVQSIGKHRKAA